MVESGDIVEGGQGEGSPQPVNVGAANDKPAVDPARAARVASILKEIKADKEHWGKDFKRMRTCMKLAAHGTTNKEEAEAENGAYVVPITNRLIGVAVATLYAKNPKAVARRKQKLMYKLWDGDPATLMAAVQQVQMAPPAAMDPTTGVPVGGPDPNAVALLAEVAAAKTEFIQYDRMAKTMELLFAYFLQEQDSGYKEMFKALVRRTKVCGVGYVELGFQRQLRKNPDISAQIADVTSQIAAIEAQIEIAQKDGVEPDTATAQRLKEMLEVLQAKEEILVREGPTLSFPRAVDIIPDRKCKHLKTFAGGRWLHREYLMDREEILATWGVDVGTNFTAYKSITDAQGNVTQIKDTPSDAASARVYCGWNKVDQVYYVVCDGYNDYIVAPAEPDVKIERFWPVFPLVFNEVEAENEDGSVSIFPPSDVWNSRHMQREYNSSRQGKREHKIAGRPRWASPRGALEKEDKENLAAAAPFSVTEVNALATGEKLTDKLMPVPVPGLDPNLYETETVFADIQRTVGVQAANLGGTSGDTATESSIAEHSRDTSNASDVDDLDTMLSALARAMGQLMLTELSKETVLEIAGPGAVWPDLPPTREQIVKDLILEVEAGSSGRPNNAAVLANYERAMPWLSLLPGVNPAPLAKKGLQALDIDTDDMFVEGAPSITALNQMARPQPGGAGPNAPDQQGDKGGDNAKQPEQPNEPGAQPSYQGPGAVQGAPLAH
ncbi:hypothetical protein [Bradyrhizobium stylosanthis]|uniref:Portal protein n=1 Tax=Bradyrhizobium stylosanthis TaxID=1803665 RepID=A0A560CXL7_9BRAD|nr:hypothetical protein [Bradyrhizobium stylosanthis]TWA89576.1 hypothetical protein FBZ96_11944 [Bradyrhizobium stylosanthis]